MQRSLQAFGDGWTVFSRVGPSVFIDFGQLVLMDPNGKCDVELAGAVEAENEPFDPLVFQGLADQRRIGVLAVMKPVFESIFQQDVTILGEIDVECDATAAVAFQGLKVIGRILGDAIAARDRAIDFRIRLLPSVAGWGSANRLAAVIAKEPLVGPFEFGTEFFEQFGDPARSVVGRLKLVFGFIPLAHVVPIAEGDHARPGVVVSGLGVTSMAELNAVDATSAFTCLGGGETGSDDAV
ncbi:MAG: hypothetical protein K1X57_00860 [Gemmataceae bacterium]|nr:hypothetical protein [Gemmataceae bacterium]